MDMFDSILIPVPLESICNCWHSPLPCFILSSYLSFLITKFMSAQCIPLLFLCWLRNKEMKLVKTKCKARVKRDLVVSTVRTSQCKASLFLLQNQFSVVFWNDKVILQTQEMSLRSETHFISLRFYSTSSAAFPLTWTVHHLGRNHWESLSSIFV